MLLNTNVHIAEYYYCISNVKISIIPHRNVLYFIRLALTIKADWNIGIGYMDKWRGCHKTKQKD